MTVGQHDSGCHARDEIASLLAANWGWPQFRIFVVLMVKNHRRKNPTALQCILKNLGPGLASHGDTKHESVSPVVGWSNPVFVLQQKR